MFIVKTAIIHCNDNLAIENYKKNKNVYIKIVIEGRVTKRS